MLRKIASKVGFLAITLVLVSACQAKPVATPLPSPTPEASFTFVDSGQDLGQGDGTSITVGDVDANGDMDTLISNADKNSIMMGNDGGGKFTKSDPGRTVIKNG